MSRSLIVFAVFAQNFRTPLSVSLMMALPGAGYTQEYRDLERAKASRR
jgi:hypothetical protein